MSERRITAQKLREWRERRNLTHEEAGAMVAHSRQAWGHWEAGERAIPGSVATLLRLCDEMPRVNQNAVSLEHSAR